MNLLPGVDAQACVSLDGVYRYWLTRDWAYTPAVLDPDPSPSAGRLVWIMLNPSTADAHTDDLTLRLIQGHTRRRGHVGLTVVNLFALRSTDPAAIRRHQDPVGPHNDEAIIDAVTAPGVDRVVVAWGANGGCRRRDRAVLGLLGAAGVTPYRLGPPTRHGKPQHPRGLRTDLPFEVHP